MISNRLGSLRPATRPLSTASSLLALALALSLTMAGAALADNVQNNVTVNGTDTFVVGGSTTINYRVVSNNGDGQTGCNASDGTPALVTINTPSGVTASPNPVVIDACSTGGNYPFPVVFTATAAAVGNHSVTVSVADANGTGGTYNTTPATFTLKVLAPSDATAPTAAPTQAPAANFNGWNNSDVTVTWNWADNAGGSGIDAAMCTTSSTSTGEGTITLNATCKDNAGNEGSAAYTVMVDMTDPEVSLVGGPAHGATYPWGYVPAAPTCSASDALSGIDGTCSVSGYGTTVGTHTVAAAATDKAGNSGDASATYTVENWTLQGFFAPVDMGYMNTVKGGSTVPLKFRVFAGQTELTDISAIKSLSAITVACPGGMATAPVEELAAAGGTVLRYDTTGGQFIYNWKTLKNPGKCYKVTMTTQDGSTIVAEFRLT